MDEYEFETTYFNFLKYDFGSFVMSEKIKMDNIGNITRVIVNKNNTKLFHSMQKITYTRDFSDPNKTVVNTSSHTWGHNIIIRGLIKASSMVIGRKFMSSIVDSINAYNHEYEKMKICMDHV